MFKKFLATSAIALTAALPAMAGNVAPPPVDDPVIPVTYVAPSADWTGFYVGANGAVGTVAGTTYWGAGLQAGYLYDMGDVVIGGELSYVRVMSPATDNFFGLDAIVGYDMGKVMPHVTFGGSYLAGPALYGVSAGAGVSFMMTDSIMLTGRYRFTYEPTGPNTLHQGGVAVSFRF